MPKLPKRKGALLSSGDLVRIGIFATMLVAVLMFRKPCADGAADFVQSFDTPDAALPAPEPKKPEFPTIRLTGEETEDQLREKIRKAREMNSP